MKKIAIMFLTILMLIFTGCSENENETEAQSENTVNTENTEEQNIEEEKTKEGNMLDKLDSIEIAETRADLKQQQGGLLTSDLLLENELEDGDQTVDIETELQSELSSVTGEIKETEQLEKTLVYLLGSPYYKQVIEKLESFEPNFEEPFLPDPQKSSEEENGKAQSGNAIILLDASSSMLSSVNGKVKMNIAKDAVKRFADVVGQKDDISLVVYGHKGSEADEDKELSCSGIEEIYPLGSYEKESFENSLTSFESKGWTPLAGAINKAAEMSRNLEGVITVYVVSDGVETCDGDPVKAAGDFANANEDRTVNIIGFDVDEADADELKKISEAGNGEYYAADNEEDLQKTIEYEWLPSAIDLAWAFTKAPGPWEILAEMDRFDAELETLKTIVKKEKERYDAAVDLLEREEMVSEEVLYELDGLIDDHYSNRMDVIDNIRLEKIDEINEIADNIKERVTEWTEEMKKLKKERGDVW